MLCPHLDMVGVVGSSPIAPTKSSPDGLSIKGPQRPARDKFGAHSQDVIANPEIIFIKQTFASGTCGPGVIHYF